MAKKTSKNGNDKSGSAELKRAGEAKSFAFLLEIESLSRLEDGAKVPIAPAEYRPQQGYFPSRRMSVQIDNQEVLLGVVEDVPAWQGVSGDSTTPQVPVEPAANGTPSAEPLAYRILNEKVLFQFDQAVEMLYLNKIRPEIQQYFRNYRSVGDPMYKAANVMYDYLHQFALSIYRRCEGAISLNGKKDVVTEQFTGEWDFIVNQMLEHEFYNNPFILHLKETIEKARVKAFGNAD